MDRIRHEDITSNSRLGFTKDALRFLQESYKETFKGIIAALNGFANNGIPIAEPIVLSGCVETLTTTVDVTPGYIYLGGEIYFCEGVSLAIVGAKNAAFVRVLDAANSYGNPIRFDDGALKDSLRRRTIEFFAEIPTFSGSGVTKLSSCVFYSKKVVELADQSTLTLTGTSSFASIQSITSTPANNFTFITKPYDAFYNICFRTNIVENISNFNSIKLFLQRGATNLDVLSRTITIASVIEPTGVSLCYAGFIPASSTIRVRYATSLGTSVELINSVLYAHEI